MRGILIAATLAGCTLEGPAPDLAFDMGSRCEAIGLEIRDADVLPGWQVYALAIERTGGARAWAVAGDDEGGMHLRAWPEGPSHDVSGLGLPHEFHLVTGATEGETWLVLDRPTLAKIWRVGDADDADDALVEREVTDFPAPGEWSRRVVFISNDPYLVAVPRTGDGAARVEMLYAPLDAATLAPGPPTAVTLWEECSTSACAPLAGLKQLQVAATSQPGPAGDAAVMIGAYGSLQSEPESAPAYTVQMLHVQLRLQAPDQPLRVLRAGLAFGTRSSPAYLGSASLASDASGFYGVVGVAEIASTEFPESDLLYRIAHQRGDAFVALSPLIVGGRERGAQALQVGDHGALAEIVDDAWTLTPLARSGTVRDLVATQVLGTHVVISSAGRGEFLVHGAGRTLRVAAICAGDDDA